MKIFDAEELVIGGVSYRAVAYRRPVQGEIYVAPCGEGSFGVFTCDVQEFWAPRLVVERVEPEYITPTQGDVVKYNFPVVEVDTSSGWSQRILIAVYLGEFYTAKTDASGTFARHSHCRMVNPNYKKV